MLLKGCVNAAMKINTYTVYVYLNQTNGEVVYRNSTCAVEKGVHQLTLIMSSNVEFREKRNMLTERQKSNNKWLQKKEQ